jgi:hypothetical protein
VDLMAEDEEEHFSDTLVSTHKTARHYYPEE